MAKLISLEGATIVVPAGWTATAGQYILHSNSYNFYCNGIGECQGIAIGYSIYFDDTPILEEDTDYVSFYLASPFGGGWAGGPLGSRESIVLSHFTGELATDETFIQWLLDNNAEITGGVWEEEDPMTQLSSFLTNIANSIRNKKSTTEPIPATNFATEIDSIETGGLTGYTGTVKFQQDLSPDTYPVRVSMKLIKPDFSIETLTMVDETTSTLTYPFILTQQITTPIIAIVFYYPAEIPSASSEDGTVDYEYRPFSRSACYGVFFPNKDEFILTLKETF